MDILDTKRYYESIKIQPVTKKRLDTERPFDKDALVYTMTDDDKQFLVNDYARDEDDLEIISRVLDEGGMYVYRNDNVNIKITDSNSVERSLCGYVGEIPHKVFLKCIACAVRHHIWYYDSLCFDATEWLGED